MGIAHLRAFLVHKYLNFLGAQIGALLSNFGELSNGCTLHTAQAAFFGCSPCYYLAVFAIVFMISKLNLHDILTCWKEKKWDEQREKVGEPDGPRVLDGLHEEQEVRGLQQV